MTKSNHALILTTQKENRSQTRAAKSKCPTSSLMTVSSQCKFKLQMAVHSIYELNDTKHPISQSSIAIAETSQQLKAVQISRLNTETA